MKKTVLLLICLFFIQISGGTPLVPPLEKGFDENVLNRIDKVMEGAVKEKKTPGAVILIGRGDDVVFRRAYGYKRYYWNHFFKKKQKMSENTIFDLASLTKGVSTASAIWKLVETGDLFLRDPVSDYVPQWEDYTDSTGRVPRITRVYHLLNHSSGIVPYLNVKRLKEKFQKEHIALEELMGEIAKAPKTFKPGTDFNYSCLNFITLGYIVEKISGKDLHEFTRDQVFRPLGMEHTFYNPDSSFFELIAPTEEEEDGMTVHGYVHDPLARMIGGVSGNAGLFSSADDLSIFARMLVNNGRWKDKRVFSPLTVKAMTSKDPRFENVHRTLGWDNGTGYFSQRGDIFGFNSFGHTGFTGTSLFIDKETGVFVIFLSNRNHPDGTGDVLRLRGIVANLAAAALIHP